MLRSSFLIRASHSLAKRKLYQHINESIESFQLTNVQDISEFQEIIKEKGFELEIQKSSQNVLLRKTTPIGKLSLFSIINPIAELTDEMKTILNPDNLKECEAFLESAKTSRRRFHPVAVTASLEVEDKAMVAEIITYKGELIIRSIIVVDAENFRLQDYSQYKGFKPVLDPNLKIRSLFNSWIKSIGIEGDVLTGFVQFCDFHYNYMTKKWMEKVKKIII